MDIPTSASTVITCTKGEFRDRLIAEFPDADAAGADRAVQTELAEVIDGLVRQADQHRGVFTGYNAYLDCQFTVTPDAADVFTIPAVTVAQRIDSATAALNTVMQVRMALAGKTFIGEDAADELDRLADALTAAAGHVRLAAGII